MNESYSIPPKSSSRVLWQYLLLLAIVLCSGFASRKYAHYLPLLIRKRTGDALWASAVFAMLTIIRPRWSTLSIAFVSLLISYCIEFSQIYHAPWIDHIRSHAIGKLILGTTFFWWDQVAYTVGIGVLVPVDWMLLKHNRAKNGE